MRKLTSIALALIASTACDKKPADPAPAPIVAAETAPAETPKPAPEAAAVEVVKPVADAPAVAEPVKVPDPAEPTPEAKPAGDDDAEKKIAAKGKTRTKLKRGDRDSATAAYKSFRQLLDEGRKLVKGDDPLNGMLKIEEALTKVPGHPSALGELGWAAYRAGAAHFDKALLATRQAIAVSKKNKQKGALWYNLGRISEDKGELSIAVDAYRQSLGFRPGNAAVQTQLEGVIAKLGGKTVDEGVAKLEEVCDSLAVEWGCEFAASAEGLMARSCSCTNQIIGPEEGFGRAALVRLEGQAEVGGSVDAMYLLIEVAAKWHVVGLVGNGWTPGMFYIYNNYSQNSFGFKTLGGKPVLWLEFENDSTDLDPGVYTQYGESSRTLTLCHFEGGAPGCWSVPLAAESSVSALSFEEDDAIPEGEGPEEKSTKWALKADINGAGEIAISIDSGEQLDPDLKSLPGTYTLSTIGQAPGVAKLEF